MPSDMTLEVTGPSEPLPTLATDVAVHLCASALVWPRYRPQRTLGAFGHRYLLGWGQPHSSPPHQALVRPGLVFFGEGRLSDSLFLRLVGPLDGSSRPLRSITLLRRGIP